MNEIDLWNEMEDLMEEKEERLQKIGYELAELFDWSDYPTNENIFVEVYNRIWEGEKLKDIIKEKNEEKI